MHKHVNVQCVPVCAQRMSHDHVCVPVCALPKINLDYVHVHVRQEASHIDGFAKECAVVTHHRLIKDPRYGMLVPCDCARSDCVTVKVCD
jgi:hypothetical protein